VLPDFGRSCTSAGGIQGELFEHFVRKVCYRTLVQLVRLNWLKDSGVYYPRGKPVICDCVPYQGFDRTVHVVFRHFHVFVASDLVPIHILQNLECSHDCIVTSGDQTLKDLLQIASKGRVRDLKTYAAMDTKDAQRLASGERKD